MVEVKTYTAVIERDEAEGLWNAHLAEEDGVFTFGRSLEAARDHIIEAAQVWFDTDDVPLRFRIELGHDEPLVEEAHKARAAAAEATAWANHATTEAVVRLSKDGYSRRDVATLLEISHQRVQQLLDAAG
jgi:predicted RNase H-like HicB family nuclease